MANNRANDRTPNSLRDKVEIQEQTSIIIEIRTSTQLILCDLFGSFNLFNEPMFRPCIDLHEGKVKQLVGGTLSDDSSRTKTNFVAEHSAAWYAELYKRDNLYGGHVIMLGPGNETEARAALSAYPGGLQIGGGINADNARDWLDAGASHVIVTSWVFREGRVDWERLQTLVQGIGRTRLVLDL